MASELEITQEVFGHRLEYVRGLGWGPCPASYGQCSGNITMSLFEKTERCAVLIFE
ncbi:hypothetical protein QJS10_CPA09g01005 [Acorus calamus]|uniref:Uncharacterized protein n=1 Tax=Acorus calamus TaxID=4465 RepID=A0AAV9E5D7_ACOCL|nr:hypothetical protein QJS10_CPA09g01005 [Acorus calamus]